MPLITENNADEFSEKIDGDLLKCWVCVFSASDVEKCNLTFEVGYSVRKRFKAYNPITSKYDGDWVEPKDELLRFADRSIVCASLYNKEEFDQALKTNGLWSTVDFSDALIHYLGRSDQDLVECYAKTNSPLLPWEEFVKQAGARRILMNAQSEPMR